MLLYVLYFVCVLLFLILVLDFSSFSASIALMLVVKMILDDVGAVLFFCFCFVFNPFILSLVQMLGTF